MWYLIPSAPQDRRTNISLSARKRRPSGHVPVSVVHNLSRLPVEHDGLHAWIEIQHEGDRRLRVAGEHDSIDGVDPFGIHRISRDGDVNAPVELTGARDQVTVSGDVLVPRLGIHELVANNDDHVTHRHW